MGATLNLSFVDTSKNFVDELIKMGYVPTITECKSKDSFWNFYGTKYDFQIPVNGKFIEISCFGKNSIRIYAENMVNKLSESFPDAYKLSELFSDDVFYVSYEDEEFTDKYYLKNGKRTLKNGEIILASTEFCKNIRMEEIENDVYCVSFPIGDETHRWGTIYVPKENIEPHPFDKSPIVYLTKETYTVDFGNGIKKTADAKSLIKYIQEADWCIGEDWEDQYKSPFSFEEDMASIEKEEEER